MTGRTIKALVAAALLVYPLTIYFADAYLTTSQLLAGLLALLALRMLATVWIIRKNVQRKLFIAGGLLVGSAMVLLVLPNVEMRWLRLYPMLFDLVVFGVFFGSLFTDRPLVERFARLMGHELPAEGVLYARRVTQGWSVLMLLVAVVSLYTAVESSLRFWSLFNGLIVYMVIGSAFCCEYVIRRSMQRKWETT